MALVILSAQSMTRSRMRTVSLRAFLGLVFVGMSIMLAGGIWLGYGFSRGVAPVSQAYALSPDALPPADAVGLAGSDASGTGVRLPIENRYLIERFGELSGRVIQLEAEALELATRLGVIEDFEERIKPDDAADIPRGREARTPPGSPAGGPLLRPTEEGGLDAVLFEDADADPAFELTEDLSRIEQDMGRLADVLSELDRVATSVNHAHMAFPGRHPVQGVGMNSRFGNRVDPVSRRRAFHSGVDFAAPRGTPIHASAGGKVIFSGNRRHYGLTVEIDHGAGLVTRYAHASKLLVKKGQAVMPGDRIALVGSTGRSTGPHLHFEILQDGHFVDPSIYLARF
ncbi:M23 family metallopeptidase [Rhodocyclaceae bacterium SMB388]